MDVLPPPFGAATSVHATVVENKTMEQRMNVRRRDIEGCGLGAQPAAFSMSEIGGYRVTTMPPTSSQVGHAGAPTARRAERPAPCAETAPRPTDVRIGECVGRFP